MPIKITTQSFIKNALKVHNNKYLYDKTVYQTAKTKVTITCPAHGDFEQTPTNHLSGKGCQKCASLVIKTKLSKTTEKFVEEANKTHNYKYSYINTKYTGNKNKVVITCHEHGEFFQEAKSHLAGSGCPKCANKTNKGAWSYSEWEQAGKVSDNFESFKVYFVKCWNDSELFYKIGKTFTSMTKRFSNFEYEWITLSYVEGSAKAISELECILHKTYAEHSYTPLLDVKRKTECYTANIFSTINNNKDIYGLMQAYKLDNK